MVRQSCIMILLNGVQNGDDDDDYYYDDDYDSEEVVEEVDVDVDDHNRGNPTAKKKWNYKLILRRAIWDMVRDDFRSFFHSRSHNFDGHGHRSGSGTYNVGSKGIVQLVGLFLHLLENSDDDEEDYDDGERCFYCIENVRSAPPSSTSTATKMDVGHDVHDGTSSSSSSSSTSTTNQDGKSDLYRFVVQGGLKWISDNVLRLVQLLLSYNNNNSNLYIQQQQHSPSKRSDEDKDDDGGVFIPPFSSPSILTKPRHYFHSLKQSCTVEFVSPTLENDILVRLSLLIDLF